MLFVLRLEDAETFLEKLELKLMDEYNVFLLFHLKFTRIYLGSGLNVSTRKP